MKKLIDRTLCFMLFVLLPGFSKAQEYMPMHSAVTGYITDMILFYHGGREMMGYDTEFMRKHLYRVDEAGDFQWLFDSFLFLSIYGPERRFFDGTFKGNIARKQEWIWLLEEYFKQEKAIAALNTVLDSL